MQLLDLTLDSPAANLALDEALLELCAARDSAGVLRFWEPPQPVLVVGRASRLADEVQLDECRSRGIPVLRRTSGGMTIVAGPGCLMYAVAEPTTPERTDIDAVHRHVLEAIATALQSIGLPVERAGTSDLALADAEGTRRKVSGNSLRIARGAYLYHGTLLYDFDLSLVSALLKHPPRSPDYRAGRPHGEFVANLPTSAAELRTAIAKAWDAREQLTDWPADRTEELARTRYATDEWNTSR